MISIIIPTFNEIKNSCIQKSFPILASLPNTEIIVVDSLSTDGTRELVNEYHFDLVDCETNSRMERLLKGIEKTSGDYIILHHPRSILEASAIKELIKKQPEWGAFHHQFDDSHPLLKFTSYWSNYVRGKRGVFYLDHCLFFHKKYIDEVLKTPNVEIFEDTEICKRLRRKAAPTLLKSVSITSALRFRTNGLLKQSYLNQKLKIQYYLGRNHKEMNKNYEKNLNLNGEYDLTSK